jgi:hypothetical protein
MSTINPQYTINGVIDTTKPVMQNINALANASGCWVTFDINQGKWAVIINRAGDSVASFNDSNIIGAITISGTGLTELYNKVEVRFPHKDILDQVDTIIDEIPTVDLYPNEPLNTLSIQYDIVNDPVQAEQLALMELKQSRVDEIIKFTTDYSKLGLKAGDLIDVTSAMLGYTNKVYRVITIEEDDGTDSIVLSITALEYDADVYDFTDIARYQRNRTNGILSQANNSAITTSNNRAGLPLSISSAGQAAGLGLIFNSLTGLWELTQGGKTVIIAATDVVISWTYPDGVDLDIRCRITSPNVGQFTLEQSIGYTSVQQAIWPPGATGGSSGTAYLEWGGDNQGPGGDPTKVESVRVDIDRIKAAFPSKRYIVVECKGNWYDTAGTRPVVLTAKLYEGGTTTATGAPNYNFSNTTSTRTRTLAGVEVFVDSFHGATTTGGYDGATAPGDLMGYFVFDTQTNTAQFTLDQPPSYTST